MLSQRRQRVLAAVIEEYVANALPVASKTLVDRYQLGVSSATIRNELSVLEDDGYISQPHTSAGRVPTDHGYRSFVDDLLTSQEGNIDPSMGEAIHRLRENARELDELLDKTSTALTDFTDCLSVVLPPSSLSLQIKRVSLIQMGSNDILMVVVTQEGRVLNRNITLDLDIPGDTITETERLINSVFAGKSFVEMRDEMDAETLKALGDAFCQAMISEMFACLQENETGNVHRIGVTQLMQQPEFSASSVLLPVLRTIEDNSLFSHILEAVGNGETVVRIGHENDNESLSNISVVASQFGRGDGAGIVAVIGPTRMQYDRAIKAVRAVQSEFWDI